MRAASRFQAGGLLLAGLVILSGCGVRAQREALRSCTYTSRGVQAQSVGDSVVLRLALEITNNGSTRATLDSFVAVAAGASPLARLSHGSTLRVAPGATDTAQVHLVVAKANLLATAMSLALAPPDSLSLEGTAWLPGWFGGYSARPLRLKVPYTQVAGQIKSLMPKF